MASLLANSYLASLLFSADWQEFGRTVEPFAKYIRSTTKSTRKSVGFPMQSHCHHSKDQQFEHSCNEKEIQLTFFLCVIPCRTHHEE